MCEDYLHLRFLLMSASSLYLGKSASNHQQKLTLISLNTAFALPLSQKPSIGVADYSKSSIQLLKI